MQWDTSNNYSNGESERIIAKAISTYDIPRDKLVIMTKCFGSVGEDPNLFTPAFQKEVGASKDYVNQRGKYQAREDLICFCGACDPLKEPEAESDCS